MSKDNSRYLPIKSVHVLHGRMRNDYGNVQRYKIVLHVLAAAQCRNLLISSVDKWQDRFLSVPTN